MAKAGLIPRAGLIVLALLLPALVTPGPVSGQQAAPVTPLVRLPFPQDDGSLTPYTFQLGHSLMTLVYDTLMWRDSRGEPQPWLARSVEASADGRQITIRLVDGVRWHDGVPLTAADVAFTFRYLADHPHPRFSPEIRAVEVVEAPEPSTVVVRLRHPSLGFLSHTLVDIPIFPAHLWRGLTPDRAVPEGPAVGSGPYRLVEYRPGRSYRFEANTDYFGGIPRVKSIEVPITAGADQALRALEQRRVDMVPFGLPQEAKERVEGLGISVASGRSYAGTALLFNLRTPPFDRFEVRQAVAMALDIDRMARAVGGSVPAGHGYLHPSSTWSPRETLHTFDPQTAAEELHRLGVASFEVLAPIDEPVKLEAGRQVALALQRLGVRAEVRGVTAEELSLAVGERGGAPTFQAAIWNIPPTVSYNPDFLGQLFGSQREQAPLNHAGYKSSAFDDLVGRVVISADTNARHLAVQETLRLLSIDLPVVPLFFAEGMYAYRPAIYEGWVFVEGSGIMDKLSFLSDAPVAEPERAGGPGPSESSRNPPLGLFSVLLMGMAVVGAITVLARNRRT